MPRSSEDGRRASVFLKFATTHSESPQASRRPLPRRGAERDPNDSPELTSEPFAPSSPRPLATPRPLGHERCANSSTPRRPIFSRPSRSISTSTASRSPVISHRTSNSQALCGCLVRRRLLDPKSTTEPLATLDSRTGDRVAVRAVPVGGTDRWPGGHGGGAPRRCRRPSPRPGRVLVRVGASDAVARVLVPGSRSRSLLGPFLSNIDAAVCWAGWDPTDDSPPAVRVARRSHARPQRRKSPDRDRIIPIDQTRPSRYVDSGVGSAISPHKRRGHWRRQRIGPRDNWEYEIRWIRPTMVGGQIAGDTPGRIYRLIF